MNVLDRIWIALDVATLEAADRIIEMLMPLGLMQYKVGLEFITRVGPDKAINCVQGRGGKVFYDGKFHDIPNTVERVVMAVVDKGVFMFNLHAQCGRKAIEKAIACKGGSKLATVTLLTSLDDSDLRDFAYPEGVTKDDVVRSLANLAAVKCGVDAIIASPLEATMIREMAPGVEIVTPGIRFADGDVGDQKRIATPGNAIMAGATALVIGRPITEAPDPALALRRVVTGIEQVLGK